MTVPKTIQIGAYTYTVEFNEERINSQRVREEDADLVGHIDNISQKISLCPKLAPDALADTVLHETIHGIFMASGIILDSDQEEKIVSALSPLLLLALRNNPELVAFLTGTNGSTPTRESKAARKT